MRTAADQEAGIAGAEAAPNGTSLRRSTVQGAGARNPLGEVLLAQLLGALVAGGLVSAFFPSLPGWPLALAGLQGSLALLFAWRLRAPVWWLPMHGLFLPLAVLAHGMALPGGFWGGGFVLLLLAFWRTDKSRVPLYLTNRRSRDTLIGLLPAGPCRVVDLGCGDGAVLRDLADARPDCRFVGVEHAPLPWAWAWLLARSRSNLSIHRGDFWNHPLGAYSLVYAFLSPAAMPALWTKVCAEMSPGAILVSNSFVVPGQVPLEVVEVADTRRTRFYVYGGTDIAAMRQIDETKVNHGRSSPTFRN